MKILIVDDSKAMRMLVRRALRQAGLDHHDIDEAEDGQDALAKVGTWDPDVILSDWNMPNLDGIGLLRALRKDGNHVRFGFVTSEGTEEMRRAAQESGANFLISKPFEASAFEAVLAPVLR